MKPYTASASAYALAQRAWLTVLVLLCPWGAEQASAQQEVMTSTKPPEPEQEDALAMCKTEDLRLSGSVYDEERPERSFAVFEIPSSHSSSVYRVGARVGAFELVMVAPRGVMLRGGDGECWLRLVGEPTSVRASSSRARAKAKAKAKAKRRSRKAKHKSKGKGKKDSHVVVIGSGAR